MRRPSPRVTAFVVVSVAVVLVVAGFVLAAWRAHVRSVAAAPTVASRDLATTLAGPHIVFRSTLPGSRYGLVAAVPLSDPGGPRAFTDQACDRIDVAGSSASCLRTIAGIATRWEARVLDASLRTVTTWGLPGIPSRTRLSDDGSLVATTVFVSGHSYVSVGFSTQTELHQTDGTDLGNVESFDLTVDGQPYNPSDKNIWGVTFVDDDEFYATAASQSAGKTWLVQGSISRRTLTAVQENAECPSVSPDRSKVAYKKVVDTVNGQSVWALAVRDVASGTETLIASTKGLDDQAEWLDDSTLLYGLARSGQPGSTDVWPVRTQADAQPSVLIPGAWSPAVSR